MKLVSYNIAFFFASQLCAIVASVTLEVQAEEVFRWRDSAGNIHYSSKPPKDNSSAEPIKKNTLSRYNANRVLKHLGKDPNKANSETQSEFKSIDPSQSGDLQKVDSVAESEKPLEIIEPANNGKISKVTSRQEIKFEQGPIEFRVDDANQITHCSIIIKNLDDTLAKDVSVAFKFSDGSLVPAVGPNEIQAKSDRIYSIPGELLPMKLKVKGDGSENVVSQPSVVIHGYN